MVNFWNVFDWIYRIVAIVIILYVVLWVTPEQNRLLEECRTEQLCAHGILQGEACSWYNGSADVNPNFLNPQ